MQWFGTEDNPPPENDYYLVTDGEIITIMVYFGTYKGAQEWSSYCCETINVTHWTYLPSLPNEKCENCKDNEHLSIGTNPFRPSENLKLCYKCEILPFEKLLNVPHYNPSKIYFKNAETARDLKSDQILLEGDCQLD